MITVAVIAILSAIAWPYYKPYREEVHLKTCMNNMKKIEGAKAQFGMTSASLGGAITWEDLMPYLRHQPICPSGGTYNGWTFTEPICCTLHDWHSDPKLEGFVP